jgi:anti-sigma factor RsiW
VTHLGDEISAVVDGELSHDARDRALAHIAVCAECRAAVEAERRTKAAIAGVDSLGLSPELGVRLLGLPAELTAPQGLRTGTAWLAEHRPRIGRRSSTSPRGPESRRPARSGRRRRRASVLTGGALVVGAFATAVLVGGGPTGGRPVTPQVDRFSVEHASVTPEVPLTDQGGPAAVVSFPLPTAP